MNIKRASSLILRHFYLIRSSFPRIFDLIYWPTVQIILWGFVSKFFTMHSDYFNNIAGVILSAAILYDFLFRSSISYNMLFLEEIWSRNIINLFVSPLKISEIILYSDIRWSVKFIRSKHLFINDTQASNIAHMTWLERQKGLFFETKAFFGTQEFLTNVYPNYALMDGTNNTPDLRNRFIVGQGSNYTSGGLWGDGIGATGGADSVALSTAQMPSHTHAKGTLKASTGGAHDHDTTQTSESGGGGTIYAEGASNASSNRAHKTSQHPGHEHDITGNTEYAGSGQAHENRPPYYVHALITRIA